MNPLPYRRRLQCIEGGSTRRKRKDETKRDNNLDEKLLLAVQNHDATEVHKLLNEGADPNVPDTSQVSSYPVRVLHLLGVLMSSNATCKNNSLVLVTLSYLSLAVIALEYYEKL